MSRQEDEKRIVDFVAALYKDLHLFLGGDGNINVPQKFSEVTLAELNCTEHDVMLAMTSFGNVIAGVIAGADDHEAAFNWFCGNLQQDILERLEMMGKGATKQ